MSKGRKYRKGRARSHGKGMGRGKNQGANKGSGRGCTGWGKTGLKSYNRSRFDLITPPPENDGSSSPGTSTSHSTSHHQSTIRVENQVGNIQSLPISKDIRTRDNGINRRPSHSVAVVDPQKCMNCGACQDVCPNDAISINKTAMVNQALCMACGQCVEECPTEAITLGEF